MFFLRERKTVAAGRRTRPMIELAATDAALPSLPDVNWAERWCTLPQGFAKIFEQLHNFEVREDDVFVVTYMKSGTTWMQETAWLLMNQLDYERAKAAVVLQRSNFLDQTGLFAELPNSVERCDEMESPRLIKCHLPMSLLPKQVWQKKSKIIYVARNVKDVVVSSYHFLKNMGLYTGNIDDFIRDFINNDIKYTPQLSHVIEFWRLRHEPHIFFVTYEEMKRDLGGVIEKLCIFLERPKLTVQEMTELVKHLNFDKMKENKSTNLTDMIKTTLPVNAIEKFQFMRRGIVGSYTDELTEANQRLLSEWSKAYLAQYGIKEEDIFGKL